MSENIQKRTRDRHGEEMTDEPGQSEADITTLKEFLQGTLGDVASDKGLIIAGILALYEDLRDDMTPPASRPDCLSPHQGRCDALF